MSQCIISIWQIFADMDLRPLVYTVTDIWWFDLLAL